MRPEIDLAADEHQQHGQGLLEVGEAVQHRRQGEVQRPQAQDRHDVRSVDDIGVGGDGEDGRHRVDGEHQVGQLHQHQGQEQRGGQAGGLAGARVDALNEEAVALQLVADGHHATQPLQGGVVGQVHGLVARKQHLHAGQDQEGGEDIQHPAELADQGCADADHDGPQDDHAQHAPEQHPVLQGRRNGEEAEDQGDDKDIVDGQAFFDHEAGQVFDPGGRAQLHPDQAAEAQAQADIDQRHQQAFAYADFTGLAVQDA